MLISCPQCHFGREVTLSQLPTSAIIATCPKCQTRFRFRDNEQKENISLSEATSTIENNEKQLIHQKDTITDEVPIQDTSTPTHSTLYINEDTATDNTSFSKEEKQEYKKNIHSKTHTQTQEPDFLFIPWEHPEKFDFFSSFYQTVTRVMFHAPRFFFYISSSSTSLLRPLFFYVLLRLFQTLMDGMWFMISFRAIEPSITESSVHEILTTIAKEMTLPITLLITPISFAMQLCIYTVFFHIMVRLVQPEQAKFRTIFRVIAYSAAPTIICILPVVGSLIGSIWFSISCFIGCKYALKLPWNKTALALIPLYLIAIAIGIQGVRQFMSVTG